MTSGSVIIVSAVSALMVATLSMMLLPGLVSMLVAAGLAVFSEAIMGWLSGIVSGVTSARGRACSSGCVGWSVFWPRMVAGRGEIRVPVGWEE